MKSRPSSGFKKYTRRDIVVAVGATAQVEVKLEVGGVAETVTVTGESPLVDTTSNEIGGRITAQEFVDTPSFNRNFAGYLGMLPGVVASISATTFGADSISVAGQNVRNVNYTMDGSNNNDTFNGGNGGAQARVPVEAVQEFQLLTSQFDAEFGLASGGVVNSVSKSGTNQYHGSAFFFHQDQNLAAVDYFAKKADLEESDSKQQQWGGTIGGPIVRDKAHYFFSLERIALDTAVTTNIPSRPDLARTDFEISRVWNTFLRADHQLTPSNTYGIRWLRETSPQPLQIQAENHTPPRHEAETDVDWTVVGNLSSVIGSTRVNTFRVSAVSEDVFFGNPIFNTNGHDQKILLPQLNYLNFQDQQSARANRRLDVAYGADDVFAWFVPGKGGDHDLKFGISYLYSSLRNQDFGNLNGTFTINSDLPFDRNNPRTYPERLMVRVPSASDFYMKGHFIGMFAQDKWKLNNNFTVNVGVRYDIELLRTPNGDNPLFTDDASDFPTDLNNLAPRLGFTWAPGSDGRSAVRGGFGVFFQRTSYTFLTNMFSNGRFSDSFTQSFPLLNFDPGPRQGNFPTDPTPRERSKREPCPHRRNVPAGNADPQHRHRPLRQPRSRPRVFAAVQPRVRAPGRIDHRGQRRFHPLRTARAVRSRGPQSGDPVQRARDWHHHAQYAARRRPGRVRGARRHAGEHRLHRLQHDSSVGDQARQQRLVGPAVVRVLARPRQHGDRAGRYRELAGARRLQSGPGVRSDGSRSSAHPDGVRLL